MMKSRALTLRLGTAFADHHDNNWIAFDLATIKGDKVDVYDGCWEIAVHPDEWELLAKSFSEFLGRIMERNRNTKSDGRRRPGILAGTRLI